MSSRGIYTHKHMKSTYMLFLPIVRRSTHDEKCEDFHEYVIFSCSMPNEARRPSDRGGQTTSGLVTRLNLFLGRPLNYHYNICGAPPFSLNSDSPFGLSSKYPLLPWGVLIPIPCFLLCVLVPRGITQH